MMVARGRVTTLAWTNAIVELSDRLQAELGQAPGWDAPSGPIS